MPSYLPIAGPREQPNIGAHICLLIPVCAGRVSIVRRGVRRGSFSLHF